MFFAGGMPGMMLGRAAVFTLFARVSMLAAGRPKVTG